MILALTMAQLACGLLVTSLLLHRSEVGGRMMQLLGAISVLLLLPWGFTDLLPAPAGRVLLAAAGLTLAWFVILPYLGEALLVSFRLGSTLLAAWGLMLAVLPLQRDLVSAQAQSWLLAVDVLTSSVLLGSTVGAMLLGHWYLVSTGMSIGPLLRLTAVMGLACFSKILTISVSLALYGWPPAREGWLFVLLLPPGLFFVIRVLLGVAGPLALTPLVWKTARIHATQSATGILYASVVLVLIGELTANFLLLLTPLPF